MYFRLEFRLLKMVIIYILLFLSITGCASRKSPIAVYSVDDVIQEESLVFGQVKALNMGKTPNFTIYLKRDELTKEIPAAIAGDGYFFWHLKPGHYTITHYYYRGWGRIWAEFEIDDTHNLKYLGTLELRGGVVSDIKVVNQLDMARKRLADQLDLKNVEVQTNLIVLEKT